MPFRQKHLAMNESGLSEEAQRGMQLNFHFINYANPSPDIILATKCKTAIATTKTLGPNYTLHSGCVTTPNVPGLFDACLIHRAVGKLMWGGVA